MTPLDIAWTLLKQARLTPQEVQSLMDLRAADRASEPPMTLADYEAEQAWREGRNPATTGAPQPQDPMANMAEETA